MHTKRAIKISHHLYLDPHPAASQKSIMLQFESVVRKLEMAIGNTLVMAELRALLPPYHVAAAMTDHQVVHQIAVKVVQGQAALKATPTVPDAFPWDDFLKVLAEHEGVIKHMYLDTKGVVTVGIGTALFSPEQATKLPFVVDKTKKPATAAEITQEYADIKKQKKGMDAESYDWTLTLPMESINSEAKRMAQDFEKAVAKDYAGYDTYPVEVKEALIDMKYELGGNMSQFVKFKQNLELAVQTKTGKYWQAAADESNRPDAQASRNAWTKAMILKGGGIDPAKPKAAAK